MAVGLGVPGFGSGWMYLIWVCFFPAFFFSFFFLVGQFILCDSLLVPAAQDLMRIPVFSKKYREVCFIKLCTVQGADSFQSLGKFRKLKGFLVCCKILKKYGKLKTMKPVWVWKKYELSLKKKRKRKKTKIFFPHFRKASKTNVPLVFFVVVFISGKNLTDKNRSYY